MYAVISTGGKQYRVQKGDVVEIERLEGDVESQVEFKDVLSIGDGAEAKVGNPTVAGAGVKGKIVEHFRGEKLIAFKMKRRKGSRKTKGHRQELTKVLIEDITV